jgi:transcriptional regulator with XRE-family HTH domain
MTRLFRDVSVEEMAKLLFIAPQDLADLEAGRKRFSAAQLAEISRRLDVHIHFFFVDKRSPRGALLKMPGLYLHFPANDNEADICATFDDGPH